MDVMTKLVDEVENEVRALGENEVSSQLIGEYVMKRLADIDEISIFVSRVFIVNSRIWCLLEELKDVMKRISKRKFRYNANKSKWRNETGLNHGRVNAATQFENGCRNCGTNTAYSERRRVLDLLYQPILGVSAYSLVTVMWRQVALTSDLKVEVTHTDLLALLNINVATLESSRQRLEAGLLRTYENQPDRLPELIYELQQPVSGKMFFKDTC